MKTSLFALLSLVSTALTSFAGVDLGSASTRTPYDQYMQPVKQVLSDLNGSTPSMEEVRTHMRQGRSFRYSFTEPYVAATPAATEARRAGDCKAKSLWLCDKLGDRNVRYVVGKARRTSKVSHAWVMWKSAEGQWFVLDPTNTAAPIPADRVSRNDYIPLFSWSKSGTYRHAEADDFMASIAGKRKSPVASRSNR